MKRIFTALFLLCLMVSAAYGVTTITSATNAASFLDQNLPNGGAAQNAMITFKGTDLGPVDFVDATFPLQKELAGVSASMTAGGSTIDLYPIRVFAPQTTLMIPSDAPIGPADVTITYNGMTSAPFRINIVANAPGMFTLASTGAGPLVATLATNALIVNSLLASASSGELWDIWITGLGAKSGDELAAPVVAQIPGVDVRVLIGGIEVVPTYAGGSGCCAALDIVRVPIPAGVSGCFVPVTVLTNGVPSNTGTMSINEGGGTCSAGNLTSDIINDAWVEGNFRYGEIDLTRFSLNLGGAETTNDSGNATFRQLNRTQFISAPGLVGNLFSNNSCQVFTFSASDDEETVFGPDDPDPDKYLAAGPEIKVTKGGDMRALMLQAIGRYSGTMGSNLPVPGTQPLFLGGGTYGFNNGPGGTDVGPFSVMATFPDAATWTNRDDIFNIPGGQNLLVTWTGAQGTTMVIVGTSIDEALDVAAGFICQTNGSAGQFSVPAWVIDALPPTGIVDGFPTAFLMLLSVSEPEVRNVDGLDALYLNSTNGSGDLVSFHTTAEEPTLPGPGGGGGTPGGGALTMTTPAWPDGGTIPARFACTGADVSPQINFTGTATGVDNIAIVMEDMSANGPSGGPFIHWALIDVPASTTMIPEGNPGNIGVALTNDFGNAAYNGPCPPAGAPHNYRIRAISYPSSLAGAVGSQPASAVLQVLSPFVNLFPVSQFTGMFSR